MSARRTPLTSAGLPYGKAPKPFGDDVDVAKQTDERPVAALPQEPKSLEQEPPTKPSYRRAATREGTKHAGVYLNKTAMRQLRMMAVREDTTVQALLIEAVNLLFHERGENRSA